MTYHIAYDHQCEACGADFIPYEEHLPCPKCGAAARTWLDYARQAAASLNVNRGDTGTFMPRGGQCRGLGEVPPLRHEIRHLFIVFVERETPHQLRDRAQVGAEAA